MKYEDFVSRPPGAPEENYIHPDEWISEDEIVKREKNQAKKRG